MAHPIRIPNPIPNPSSSSIDPNSGFCSETKTYHSIRPHCLLPPETTSLSITDFVFSLLLQNSPSSPETTAALIDAATCCHIPYPDVVTRTKTLAASLHHQIGLSNGHSAFVLSPNSVQIPILYLSLFSLGVTVSASNLTSSKSEISRQIDLSKPVIAFTISDTAHNLPSLLHHSPEFESMMTNRTRKFHRISVSQSDKAAMLYSSGTTGKSKGVELSHRNFISSLAGSQAPCPVRFLPAVSFCAVPYFHVYGFLLCLRAVAIGESLVCIGRFDVGMMIRAIDKFRVTQVALAPPVIVAMVRKGDLMDGGHDLSSLEVVACSGAPLPNAVIERFKKRFPGVLVAQIGDNAPAGSERPINLNVEGDDHNTETRDQSHGVKDASQEGDAPKTTDRSGYYNEDDLQVWKDRYLRRNEDPSRRDAKTGGISAPKEITFKYRRTHPK
ncbi:hypothetical protein ACSBR1_011084 [Camellia fascicularis]